MPLQLQTSQSSLQILKQGENLSNRTTNTTIDSQIQILVEQWRSLLRIISKCFPWCSPWTRISSPKKFYSFFLKKTITLKSIAKRQTGKKIKSRKMWRWPKMKSLICSMISVCKCNNMLMNTLRDT